MNYYYCYSIKKGLFDKEKEYAKDLGVYIFYDESEDTFYDIFNNQIDIKDKKIFPRTGALQATTLIDAIIRHGGDCLLTKDDYEKTLNWPYFVKTIRNNIILSGSEIIANPQHIIDIFGNDKVFFKTKFKNFSQVIEVSNFFEEDSPFFQTLEEHQNDDFIISDDVSILKDQYGPLEYRAFIVNGEILNISRISDYLLCRIPKEVLDKLQDIVLKLKETDFSKSYVVDLFEYENKKGEKEIDILECNPIIASGTYLYNSVLEKIEDIEHKCPSSSIPKEKIKYGDREEYSFDVINELSPSIYYNLSGGFAADLTSFSIFGIKSSENMYFHFSGGSINFLGLSSLRRNTLLCDEDLTDNSDKIAPKKRLKTKEEK